MKPTIFTVNLWNMEHIDDQDIFIESWKNQMLGYDIKIYTENDDIVKEAISNCGKWIDFCNNCKLYDYIKLYFIF